MCTHKVVYKLTGPSSATHALPKLISKNNQQQTNSDVLHSLNSNQTLSAADSSPIGTTTVVSVGSAAATSTNRSGVTESTFPNITSRKKSAGLSCSSMLNPEI